MGYESLGSRGNELGPPDGLMTNRAMRRYSGEPVSDEDIWTCLQAAVQAPSGGNIQPYQFVIVQEPEQKQRLADIYRRGWRRYEPAIAPTEFPNDAVREGWEKNNILLTFDPEAKIDFSKGESLKDGNDLRSGK